MTCYPLKRYIHKAGEAIFIPVTIQRTMRILLADDDEDDREFFRLALEKVNIRAKLETVANGAQAVAKMENPGHLFDLLFLDINMPLMDGIECLAIVRQMFPASKLPVIMLSTSGAPANIERCFRLGADFYLKKPSSLEVLTSHIQFCLSSLMNGVTPATRTIIGT